MDKSKTHTRSKQSTRSARDASYGVQSPPALLSGVPYHLWTMQDQGCDTMSMTIDATDIISTAEWPSSDYRDARRRAQCWRVAFSGLMILDLIRVSVMFRKSMAII